MRKAVARAGKKWKREHTAEAVVSIENIFMACLNGQAFFSEEYLSSQFKKETGAGFTETIRKYRIERIKGLLAGTRIKINQIAELTGHADSKYMSKVFKDETGMLPTEFHPFYIE